MVARLVVLLAITDMICRAYVTAKRNAAASASGLDIPIAVHTAEGAHLDAELHEMRTVDGHDDLVWRKSRAVVPVSGPHSGISPGPMGPGREPPVNRGT